MNYKTLIRRVSITQVVLALAFIAVLAIGCTQNQRAKAWGGTAKVDLPAGQKVVTVTWEQTHLWILTRPMRTNETPEVYDFQEQSSWGVLQGTYVITEK